MNLCESCKKWEVCGWVGVQQSNDLRFIVGTGDCHGCADQAPITRADLATKDAEIAELKLGVVVPEFTGCEYPEIMEGIDVPGMENDLGRAIPKIIKATRKYIISRMGQSIPADRILKEGEVAVDRAILDRAYACLTWFKDLDPCACDDDVGVIFPGHEAATVAAHLDVVRAKKEGAKP